jgi:hypothetical protein
MCYPIPAAGASHTVESRFRLSRLQNRLRSPTGRGAYKHAEIGLSGKTSIVRTIGSRQDDICRGMFVVLNAGHACGHLGGIMDAYHRSV